MTLDKAIVDGYNVGSELKAIRLTNQRDTIMNLSKSTTPPPQHHSLDRCSHHLHLQDLLISTVDGYNVGSELKAISHHDEHHPRSLAISDVHLREGQWGDRIIKCIIRSQNRDIVEGKNLGAIMAVGALRPTVVATKDGRIGLKNQMQVYVTVD